ncbi:MAG: prepilin-type N-terminal cleavage/methylation domain-containing protein [bacterium]|nr:prepilin-type N-terminal cleavage/methylation domain-containing protein [bacterium]
MSSDKPASHADLSRAASGGFTLLEIVIVVTVVALVVGITLPRLPDVGGARIYRSARKIGNALLLARSRAVSLRRYYRVDLDLEENSIELSYFGPEGTFIKDDELRPAALGQKHMTDVVTGSGGKTREGEGSIHISPRGQVEPSLVHLADDRGRVLTVIPAPFGGRVTVNEGYLELAAGL